MNAWLTARRIKDGQEQEFRRKWRGGGTPEGMLDAVLLEDEQDPRETLSLSFWDSAQDLLRYRTSDESRKRDDDLAGLVEKDRWSRGFVAWNAWDVAAPGGKKKWLIPLALIGAGVAAFMLLRRRGGSEPQDDWDDWDEAETPTGPDGGLRAQHGPEPDGRNGGPRPAQTTETNQRDAMHMAHTPTNKGDLTRGTPTAPVATPGVRAAGGAPGAGVRGRRTVADLMTPDPETVDTRTTAAAAAMMMRDLDVGVLPVVADGQLAGVITDRDIALAFVDRKLKPSQVRVGDLMTETPVTATPSMTAAEAAELMADHQVRRLPVVEGTRLVGIISLGDLAADGAEAAAAGALEEISEPAAPRT
jgi:CBS domain-containing protein/heme-degrading monooxygenase HmoA